MVVENQDLPPAVDEMPPPNPRFSLLSLFGAIAAVAAGLAMWRAVGPIVGAGVLIGLLAILAHVAGNAIGNQLRDGTTERLQRRSGAAQGEPLGGKLGDPLQADRFAPATQLSRRKPLGWFMIVGSVLGVVIGVVGGGYAMYWIDPDAASVAGMLVGCVGTGLLGGLAGFWSCSFAQVVFGAWREATGFSKRNRER